MITHPNLCNLNYAEHKWDIVCCTCVLICVCVEWLMWTQTVNVLISACLYNIVTQWRSDLSGEAVCCYILSQETCIEATNTRRNRRTVGTGVFCKVHPELPQLYPSGRETSSCVISRLQPGTMSHENTTSSQGNHWEDVFLEVHVTRATNLREDVFPEVHFTRVALRSCTASRYATPPTISTADMGKACGLPCGNSNICHNKKFRRQVCRYRLAVCLTVTC
jgi:hypothetical protein